MHSKHLKLTIFAVIVILLALNNAVIGAQQRLDPVIADSLAQLTDDPLAQADYYTDAWLNDKAIAVLETSGRDDAETLWRLAQEQTPFTNSDFKAWQKRMKLSNQDAADALGLSLSTIKNIRTDHVPVSNALAIACRAMEAEPVTFAAHYFPRKSGRPKAA